MRIIKFFFLFTIVTAHAQVDVDFVRHLSHHRLQAEHGAYLSNLPASDTSQFFRARYHLQYFNDSLLLQHYFLSRAYAPDTFFVKEAGLQLLKSGKEKHLQSWFSDPAIQSDAPAAPLQLIYRAGENPNEVPAGTLPDNLQGSYLAYKKMFNKKPWKAAAYSALVPGLGKWYAGKKSSALLGFLINVAYGAQSYESYRRLGPAHPFSIVNYSALAVFYFANVYGSHQSIIQLRKENKKQFISEAVLYYSY